MLKDISPESVGCPRFVSVVPTGLVLLVWLDHGTACRAILAASLRDAPRSVLGWSRGQRRNRNLESARAAPSALCLESGISNLESAIRNLKSDGLELQGEFQREIERRSAVGDPSDGNQVDARGRDGFCRLGGDSTGSFRDDSFVHHTNGFFQHG